MKSAPFAISLEKVEKSFRRRTVRGGITTFKTQVVNLFSKSQREKFQLLDVHALKGVDLQIAAGTTLGIIGENGSGKSTLLKILTGIYAPSSGKVTVNGRISALLELGAGFHPDFSGRENIVINGVILGLSRAQIESKADAIIDFSELREFIDEPVRTYSSGMYMRLAFAVATLVDPDILIIDEILSVGDEHFTRKSRAKMEEFKAKRKTIVLVSHDLATIESWCDTAAWLDRGKIAAIGDPAKVIGAYRQRVAQREMSPSSAPAVPETAPVAVMPEAPRSPSAHSSRWGDQRIVICDVTLSDGEGRPRAVFDPESSFSVRLDFEVKSDRPMDDVVVGIGFFRADDGLSVFGTNTSIEHFDLPKPFPRRGTVTFSSPRLSLLEGNYRMDVAVHSKDGLAYDYHRGLYQFAVRSDLRQVGVARIPHQWAVSAGQGPSAGRNG